MGSTLWSEFYPNWYQWYHRICTLADANRGDRVLKNHHRVRSYKRRSWEPKEIDAIIAADGGWHNPAPGDSAG